MSQENHQILLGTILSSLTKYYHFLTCSTWGFWHDEIHEEEHLSLPIRFPKKSKLQQRILKAVHQISTQREEQDFFDTTTIDWQSMQDELDEAIFDLYELSEPQRDLVRDLCQTTLEFFYEGADSRAVKPPTIKQLEAYRDAFLEIWVERLIPKGAKLETTIYAPHYSLLYGMTFELKERATAISEPTFTNIGEWQHWFEKLNKVLRKELNESVYINRVVKDINESGMLLIKRAEKRLWTKSQARQDAQELMTEVFKLEWQK